MRRKMRANLKAMMKRVTAVMFAMILAFAGVSVLGSSGVARGAESEDNASEGDLGVTVAIIGSRNADSYGVGSEIEYAITVVNTGENVIRMISIQDSLSGETTGIERFESLACKEFDMRYTIKQSDVDAGVSSLIKKIEDKEYLTVTSAPYEKHMSGSFKITSTPANGNFYVLGEMVTYKLTAVNDGDVPLTDVRIYDAVTGEQGGVIDLKVGESIEIAGHWTVTEKDVTRGNFFGEPVGVAIVSGGAGGEGGTLENPSEKSIEGIGTTAITSPREPERNEDPWIGNYVYYGTYDGKSVKYRVLDPNTTEFSAVDANGKKAHTMLMDCDTILFNHIFDPDLNVWYRPANEETNREELSCELRDYLNKDSNGFYCKTGVFSDAEKAAITASTTGTVSENETAFHLFSPMFGDYIFLLSAREISQTKYGYYYDTRVVSLLKTGDGSDSQSDYWWLRSTMEYVFDNVYNVTSKGNVAIKKSTNEYGVSPAFNIDLSSVIFATKIKTVYEKYGEYKLTVVDKDLQVAAPTGDDVAREDDKVTIAYNLTGDNASKATRMSVLILDREFEPTDKKTTILQYEKLTLDKATPAESAKGSFTLDTSNSKIKDGKWGEDFFVYLLAEDENDGVLTDYASAPVLVAEPGEAQIDIWITTQSTPENKQYYVLGEQVEYEIMPINNGTATARDFSITDKLTGVVYEHFTIKPDSREAIKVKYTITEADVLAGKITLGTGITADEDIAGTIDEFELRTGKLKAPESLTAEQKPTANSPLTEDGSDLPLVTAPKNAPEGYTVEYSLDGETWSKEIPTGKEAGKYTVEVRYNGGGVREDFPGESLEIVINEKPKTQYTVIWKDANGAELDRKTYEEGQAEPATEKKPAKAADDTYTYTFSGWDAGTVSGTTKTYEPKFTAIPKKMYTADAGALTHTLGTETDATMHISRAIEPETCYAHFAGEVYVGTVKASRGKDYTDASGSTVITLKAAFLNTLTEGDHTVRVVFDDGEYTTKLAIEAAAVEVTEPAEETPATTEESAEVVTSPKTADTGSVGVWMLVLAIAGGMAVVGVRVRRRREAE